MYIADQKKNQNPEIFSVWLIKINSDSIWFL